MTHVAQTMTGQPVYFDPATDVHLVICGSDGSDVDAVAADLAGRMSEAGAQVYGGPPEAIEAAVAVASSGSSDVVLVVGAELQDEEFDLEEVARAGVHLVAVRRRQTTAALYPTRDQAAHLALSFKDESAGEGGYALFASRGGAPQPVRTSQRYEARQPR